MSKYLVQLAIDHQSKLPLYVQVEELLRKMILSPGFQNGNLLPTEIELANRLGVSRGTIRQATNKLEYEGLLIRKKGVGTKIAVGRTLSTGLDSWYSFTEEMCEQGMNVGNLKIKVQRVQVNAKVAIFFNIQESKTIIKLSKLKGVGEEPIVYFESYFHPRIGLNEKDDFSMPLYKMLEQKYGVHVVRSSENISVELAGSKANMLKMEPHDPILVRERFVYDPGDRPIEYNIGYYRGDKFSYSIDIKKPDSHMYNFFVK